MQVLSPLVWRLRRVLDGQSVGDCLLKVDRSNLDRQVCRLPLSWHATRKALAFPVDECGLPLEDPVASLIATRPQLDAHRLEDWAKETAVEHDAWLQQAKDQGCKNLREPFIGRWQEPDEVVVAELRRLAPRPEAFQGLLEAATSIGGDRRPELEGLSVLLEEIAETETIWGERSARKITAASCPAMPRGDYGASLASPLLSGDEDELSPPRGGDPCGDRDDDVDEVNVPGPGGSPPTPPPIVM